MESIHFSQSLTICCSLAALGGALETAATAVTAIPAVRAKEGIKITKCMNLVWIGLNITLQLTGSVIGHLFATWFGPISLVVPFFFSASLLCNILVVGILREPFDKNRRVGTQVIIVSVVLLPIVGPTIQDGQDFMILMDHFYSFVWLMMLSLASLGTAVVLAFGITRYSERGRVVILLVSRVSSLCVNLTVSRALALQPSAIYLVILIAAKVISGFIYTRFVFISQ